MGDLQENGKISPAESDEERQHPTHDSRSRFEYVRIAKQTTSVVVLEWKYIDYNCDIEKVYKIVKLKNHDEWETICWSRKLSCVIKNLEQNTCYSIKVLVMQQLFDKFQVVDSSEILKVIYNSFKSQLFYLKLLSASFSAQCRLFHHTRHLFEQCKSHKSICSRAT